MGVNRFSLRANIRPLFEGRLFVTNQRDIQQLYTQTTGLGQLDLVNAARNNGVIRYLEDCRSDTREFKQLANEITERPNRCYQKGNRQTRGRVIGVVPRCRPFEEIVVSDDHQHRSQSNEQNKNASGTNQTP